MPRVALCFGQIQFYATNMVAQQHGSSKQILYHLCLIIRLTYCRINLFNLYMQEKPI